MRMISTAAVGLGVFLVACQPAREPYSDEGEIPSSESAYETAIAAPVVAATLSSEDKGRACRAIIASLNGSDPNIISVISSRGDLYRVRYTRDDGTVWTNECQVGKGTARWRMVENNRVGRWRTEDTVRFTVDGQAVSVETFMNGEPMTSDSYTIN